MGSVNTSIASVIIDLGCLLPGRYERVAAYAEIIGVDPSTLVALLTGVVPEDLRATDAGDLSAPLQRALRARTAADCGALSWREALDTATVAFEDIFGMLWDAAAYGRFMAAGPGPALSLRRGHIVTALSERLPVITVATAPRDLVAVSIGLIDLPLPVQVSADLGCARPDPDVWRAALARADVACPWHQTMVVVDLPQSADALQGLLDGPAETWLVNDDASEDQWAARVDELLR